VRPRTGTIRRPLAS